MPDADGLNFGNLGLTRYRSHSNPGFRPELSQVTNRTQARGDTEAMTRQRGYGADHVAGPDPAAAL